MKCIKIHATKEEQMEKELKEIMDKIEVKKTIIAKQRDELREIESELTDLLDKFDGGIESLDVAMQEFSRAIDTLSEVV